MGIEYFFESLFQVEKELIFKMILGVQDSKYCMKYGGYIALD